MWSQWSCLKGFFFSTVDSVLPSVWLADKTHMFVSSSSSHSPEHKHLSSANLCHASRLQTSRFSSTRLLHLLLSVFWRHILGSGGFAQWRECTGHVCGDASCVDERAGCVFCLVTVVQELGNTCWSTVSVVPSCGQYHTKSAGYYDNWIWIILASSCGSK